MWGQVWKHFYFIAIAPTPTARLAHDKPSQLSGMTRYINILPVNLKKPVSAIFPISSGYEPYLKIPQ